MLPSMQGKGMHLICVLISVKSYIMWGLSSKYKRETSLTVNVIVENPKGSHCSRWSYGPTVSSGVFPPALKLTPFTSVEHSKLLLAYIRSYLYEKLIPLNPRNAHTPRYAEMEQASGRGRITSPPHPHPHPLRAQTQSGTSSCSIGLMLSAECV